MVISYAPSGVGGPQKLLSELLEKIGWTKGRNEKDMKSATEPLFPKSECDGTDAHGALWLQLLKKQRQQP